MIELKVDERRSFNFGPENSVKLQSIEIYFLQHGASFCNFFCITRLFSLFDPKVDRGEIFHLAPDPRSTTKVFDFIYSGLEKITKFYFVISLEINTEKAL